MTTGEYDTPAPSEATGEISEEPSQLMRKLKARLAAEKETIRARDPALWAMLEIKVADAEAQVA
jgi:hypothetical protein